MKNVHYLLAFAFSAAAIFLLNSCKEDISDTPSPGYILSAEEIEYIGDNFCSTPDFDGAAEDRATGVKGRFWPAGTVLRVKFLNGSHSMRHKVFNYAKQWAENANFSFQKVDTGYSDIRVRFGMNGNKSEIGTVNQTISQNKPTMNLQLTDFSSEEKIRRHVLHEFGHALGLVHEHQNPLANILWNIPKVYAYFIQSQGWDSTQVYNNVLKNYGWGPVQHTVFDPQSIMVYSVPDNLTTNGFSIPWNTELSTKDKEFIIKMYDPKKIHVRHDADISGTVTFLLNGVSTTLKKGEGIFVPVVSINDNLQVWECPDACMWSPYDVTLNLWYKIVSDPDNPNDLYLEQDLWPPSDWDSQQ